MKYHYQGYDRKAQVVNGTIDASSDKDALNKLRELNIMPKLLEAEAPEAGVMDSLFSSEAPSLKEFIVFIRQLSVLQNAGLPIVQSLEVLSTQTPNKGFAAVIGRVKKQVEEGSSLAEAVQKFPHVFDRTFVHLIAAGEVSGSLDVVFARMAKYYEKIGALRRRILSALLYPSVILAVVFSVFMFLLGVVVPAIARMFKQQSKQLPEITTKMIALSDFIRGNFPIIGLVVVATIFLIFYFVKSKDARDAIDPLLLKVPVFGNIFLKSCLARFSRTLATMIQSGVPILDGLEVTAKVSGNVLLEDAILDTKDSIREGNTIAGPLSRSNVFPPMVVSMVAIGEQTGDLDVMLEKIADFYEDEVETIVSALTTIIEPLMIVLVGLLVLGVLVPMYLPLFQMGELVGK